MHILGPWEASGTEAFGLSDIVAPAADFHEGHLVAIVNNYFFKDGITKTRLPREQVDARARLIAAAPTMADYIKKRASLGDTEAEAIVEMF